MAGRIWRCACVGGFLFPTALLFYLPMCTLVLLLRPGELLAISGNRNEMLSRPSSGPRVENGILAPRDEVAHGTWLGLNHYGLFVCVTNRRGGIVDPARRSRR